jgi:heat shock protein HslJ
MSRWSNAVVAVLVIVISVFLVAGYSCGSHSLQGTQWRLGEWTLSSLDPADLTITAQFLDGKISGSGGVNTYSGPYKLGPGTTFSAGPLATMEMAGPEPAMRGEKAYLTLLRQAKSYEMAAGKLTLYDAGGNVSLVFDAVSK